MAEYIERDALIQKYRSEIEKMREYAINTPNGDDENVLECRGELTGMRMALEFIQRYPAADVVEVRHGRWIVFNDGTEESPQRDHMRCSVCGWYWSIPEHRTVFSRCPNCGAKMDGGNRNAG